MSGKLRLFRAEAKVPLWHWIAAGALILVTVLGLVQLWRNTGLWQVQWILIPAVALGMLLPVCASIWPRLAGLFRALLTVLLLSMFPVAAGLLVNLISQSDPPDGFPWEFFSTLCATTVILAFVWILMKAFEGSNTREQRQLDKRIMQHQILLSAEPVVSVTPRPYPAIHEA